MQEMAALNVLIIEDDALIGMLLTEMLQGMGHDVCATAVTEEDAVAGAIRCKPSLIIADEHLLEGSGSSAVERIFRTGSVPCVFMSGAHMRRAGATVLQKPFLEADLVRAIRTVVGSAVLPAGPEARPGPLSCITTRVFSSSQHLTSGSQAISEESVK